MFVSTTNRAGKLCLPWERLFVWLNSRLEPSEWENRLVPGRAEMLQLQLHVAFAFVFPSYLQHLKIRTATEAHACKGVILRLLLLFKS